MPRMSFSHPYRAGAYAHVQTSRKRFNTVTDHCTVRAPCGRSSIIALLPIRPVALAVYTGTGPALGLLRREETGVASASGGSISIRRHRVVCVQLRTWTCRAVRARVTGCVRLYVRIYADAA